MGRFEYAQALAVFEQLSEEAPSWHDVRINRAIALKNRQEAGDAELALQQLAIVIEDQPNNLRANYVAGVLQLYLGNVAKAEQYFQNSIANDPSDAYAHYYLGQCQLRSGNLEASLSSYNTAMKLDPYLRSAYYSAALVMRRLGQNNNADNAIKLFQKFENNPAARLAEFKYTRMGPKSLAMVVGNSNKPNPVLKRSLEGKLFTTKRTIAELSLPELERAPALSTVDYDLNGQQDIVVTNPQGSDNRVLIAGDSPDLTSNNDLPWSGVDGINAIAWGDINNDGLTDAYLCRSGENQLWMRYSDTRWQLTAPEAGANDSQNDCSDATLADVDHDGDLDIVVANKNAANNLLNNNRDGTFRPLANKLGNANKNKNTRHILLADLDSDNDVDLIFVNETAPHDVLINDRLWNFVPSHDFNDFSQQALHSLAAADINGDGQSELVSVNNEGIVKIWQPSNAGAWVAHKVYETSIPEKSNVDLVPIDLNGSGRAELALLANGLFEIISLSQNNTGNWVGSLQLRETYLGGKAIPIIRSAKGSSLIAATWADNTASGGANNPVSIVEWAPGLGRHQFITLNFSGKHDAAETMRSNHSGIGTRVSVRSGSQWSIANSHKHSSLRGYNLQPLAIGLGGYDKADFVAVDWSDGVYQTELDVLPGTTHLITEEQRQLGSCPVLFAWNGEKFDFVTDILGVAAQGFLVEPGVLLPPRPWEKVLFTPERIQSKDNKLQFKITEPMEENSYIDSVRLEVYDLPENWKVVIDERMGTAPPEVTGNNLYYQTSLQPVQAYNSAGLDVLELISRHDNRAMAPGEIDRRFIGILKQPETLTLEFAAPINKHEESVNAIPVLVAESWVELPYSQTHFSAWQAGVNFQSVSFEARDANNKWHVVYPQFGIPGGMPRTISLPMLDLPSGTQAIRLSWNREIYWDRIRVVYAEETPKNLQHQTLLPSLARVNKTGFFKRVNHAQRRPEYLYQDRKTFGDVKYPTGMYTQLGEMTELIKHSDDALAIIGPGEEIHIEFENIPPETPGTNRWYVLDTKGWAKDKDLYTHQGEQVGPLPRTYPDQDTAQRDALHYKYNTRFQSGR